MYAEEITAAVEASTDRTIVLLFNCSGREDFLKASLTCTGRSIGDVLDLRSREWPASLRDAIFIAAFQVAVPLQPGLTMQGGGD